MQNIMLSTEQFVPGVPCNRNVRAPLGESWQLRLEEFYNLCLTPAVLNRRELDATLVVDIPTGLSAFLLQVSFLDQSPNNILHVGSPPRCHGVTGISFQWHGTSRGALQLKNNPSLLFEVQGLYHENLLWLCNICSLLTTWRRVFPSRRGKR